MEGAKGEKVKGSSRGKILDKREVLKGPALKPVLFCILTSDLCTITERLRNEDDSNMGVHQGKTSILWVACFPASPLQHDAPTQAQELQMGCSKLAAKAEGRGCSPQPHMP